MTTPDRIGVIRMGVIRYPQTSFRGHHASQFLCYYTNSHVCIMKLSVTGINTTAKICHSALQPALILMSERVCD